MTSTPIDPRRDAGRPGRREPGPAGARQSVRRRLHARLQATSPPRSGTYAPALRAVLLRADGANYSYGGDLKSFYPVRDQLGPLVRRVDRPTCTWACSASGICRCRSSCAVQGFAMGGGVALLAGCDVVLAGESARFGSAFAQLGFSCDSGSSATLTARMGAARARRFVMLAEVLTSAEALARRPRRPRRRRRRLQDEALALAQRWPQGPTLAYGEIKRLFLRAGHDAARRRSSRTRP